MLLGSPDGTTSISARAFLNEPQEDATFARVLDVPLGLVSRGPFVRLRLDRGGHYEGVYGSSDYRWVVEYADRYLVHDTDELLAWSRTTSRSPAHIDKLEADIARYFLEAL